MKRKILVYSLAVLLIAAYCLRTVIRNRDWKSYFTIWPATVRASPESPKARNNMGDLYVTQGELEKAVEEFKISIQLKPDYAEAYHNLAVTYYKMGRRDEAALVYQQAVKYDPRQYESHINLAALYLEQGQRNLALAHIWKAHQLNPQDETVKNFYRQLSKNREG